MKVQGPHRPSPLEVARSGNNVPASPQRGSFQEPLEKVELSDEARILLEARRPEEPDQSRIERLAEAIRLGNFKINLERIAEAMMNEEL